MNIEWIIVLLRISHYLKAFDHTKDGEMQLSNGCANSDDHAIAITLWSMGLLHIWEKLIYSGNTSLNVKMVAMTTSGNEFIKQLQAVPIPAQLTYVDPATQRWSDAGEVATGKGLRPGSHEWWQSVRGTLEMPLTVGG